MLFTLKEIQEYRLHAIDGDFGEIRDVIIDDQDWAVRYLIVGIGSRQVLLSIYPLSTPDMDKHVLPVNLTQEKMMNSPVIDFGQPVSREVERQISDYFDWPYYWAPDEVPDTRPGDLTAVPLIEMELDREEQEQEELIPQTGETSAGQQNGHLQSAKAMFGSVIHASNDDHDAGKLVDMLTGNEDWSILYLVVDTGGMLSGRKTLIAPTWVEQMDVPHARIDINLSSETIHNSPEFSSTVDLSEDYQDRLRDYYDQF